MKVSSQIEIYETDNKSVSAQNSMSLFVESYWNGKDRVVLLLPNGVRFVVNAYDLHLAINNATNKR